jgi:enterochelin esterase-like enzyme
MVMICIGDKDMVEGSLNYHNALTENGVEHIWYLYPGGEHSDPVWKNAIINFVRYSLGDMELS